MARENVINLLAITLTYDTISQDRSYYVLVAGRREQALGTKCDV
jgi:hypothetical protein